MRSVYTMELEQEERRCDCFSCPALTAGACSDFFGCSTPRHDFESEYVFRLNNAQAMYPRSSNSFQPTYSNYNMQFSYNNPVRTAYKTSMTSVSLRDEAIRQGYYQQPQQIAYGSSTAFPSTLYDTGAYRQSSTSFSNRGIMRPVEEGSASAGVPVWQSGTDLKEYFEYPAYPKMIPVQYTEVSMEVLHSEVPAATVGTIMEVNTTMPKEECTRENHKDEVLKEIETSASEEGKLEPTRFEPEKVAETSEAKETEEARETKDDESEKPKDDSGTSETKESEKETETGGGSSVESNTDDVAESKEELSSGDTINEDVKKGKNAAMKREASGPDSKENMDANTEECINGGCKTPSCGQDAKKQRMEVSVSGIHVKEYVAPTISQPNSSRQILGGTISNIGTSVDRYGRKVGYFKPTDPREYKEVTCGNYVYLQGGEFYLSKTGAYLLGVDQ